MDSKVQYYDNDLHRVTTFGVRVVLDQGLHRRLSAKAMATQQTFRLVSVGPLQENRLPLCLTASAYPRRRAEWP